MIKLWDTNRNTKQYVFAMILENKIRKNKRNETRNVPITSIDFDRNGGFMCYSVGYHWNKGFQSNQTLKKHVLYFAPIPMYCISNIDAYKTN